MSYKERIKIVLLADIDGETAEGELRSLSEWLTQESPSAGRTHLVRASEPDAMGGAWDAVEVALGAGGAVSVLAGSISTWIKTRHRPVRLRVRRPDGEELEISGDVRDPDALIEQFLEHTEPSR